MRRVRWGRVLVVLVAFFAAVAVERRLTALEDGLRRELREVRRLLAELGQEAPRPERDLVVFPSRLKWAMLRSRDPAPTTKGEVGEEVTVRDADVGDDLGRWRVIDYELSASGVGFQWLILEPVE